jgi:hypothetical protein
MVRFYISLDIYISRYIILAQIICSFKKLKNMRKGKNAFMLTGIIVAATTFVVTTTTIKKRNKEFKQPKSKKNDGILSLPEKTGTDLDWKPEPIRKHSRQAFIL